MRCLIPAAGRGSRLARVAEPKPLAPLLGVPLIERVIRTAARAGVREFCVTVGHAAEPLRRHLEALGPRLGLDIRCVANPDWEAGNGTSVLAARACLGEGPFLILMADHLVDERTVRALLRRAEAGHTHDLLLAVDTDLGNPLVDPDDVTRVRLEDGRITAIGKGLAPCDGYDTGAFLAGPALFEAMERAWREQGEPSLTAAVRLLAAEGRAHALDLRRAVAADAFWIDVDDARALRRAEEALLRRLRNKATDGPVSRWLNRPLSIRLTRHLARLPVTPNQLSLATFALGCLAALVMALPGPLALALGGLLAQASSVLDGCDGELARLRFQESDFGGWLDAVLDRYADGFLLAGLTWHVYAATGAAAHLLVGLLAVTGSFALSYTADKYDGLMRARLGRGAPWRLGRDVRVFIVFLGAVLNAALAALVVVAALMNAEVARRIWVARRAAAAA